MLTLLHFGELELYSTPRKRTGEPTQLRKFPITDIHDEKKVSQPLCKEVNYTGEFRRDSDIDHYLTKTHMYSRQGRIWSLQNDQEIALKKVWAFLLKSFGYPINISLETIEKGDFLCGSVTKAQQTEQFGLCISSKGTSTAIADDYLASYTSIGDNIKNIYYVLETGGYEYDDIFSLCKPEGNKSMRKYGKENLHKSLWALSRNDNIDNYFLRFLRIFDFKARPSLSWITEVLDLRLSQYNVDELLFGGDSHFYFDQKKSPLVDVFRRNEFYIRGNSRSGCPIIYFQATQHMRGRCSDADFEKVILLYIEWARLRLLESRKGVDQFHLIIDLSGFTMKYADYHGVKFAIKAFQRTFPDSIEMLQIHNSPRIFSAMWKILEHWMKPYLRQRIFFTKTIEELTKHIDPKYIPVSLGGSDQDPSSFIEPTFLNCQWKTADETFYELKKERDELTIKFIESTIRWIESSTSEESKVHLMEKIALSNERALNYINLDPYLRTRGVPDRNGEILSLLH